MYKPVGSSLPTRVSSVSAFQPSPSTLAHDVDTVKRARMFRHKVLMLGVGFFRLMRPSNQSDHHDSRGFLGTNNRIQTAFRTGGFFQSFHSKKLLTLKYHIFWMSTIPYFIAPFTISGENA